MIHAYLYTLTAMLNLRLIKSCGNRWEESSFSLSWPWLRQISSITWSLLFQPYRLTHWPNRNTNLHYFLLTYIIWAEIPYRNTELSKHRIEIFRYTHIFGLSIFFWYLYGVSMNIFYTKISVYRYRYEFFHIGIFDTIYRKSTSIDNQTQAIYVLMYSK